MSSSSSSVTTIFVESKHEMKNYVLLFNGRGNDNDGYIENRDLHVKIINFHITTSDFNNEPNETFIVDNHSLTEFNADFIKTLNKYIKKYVITYRLLHVDNKTQGIKNFDKSPEFSIARPLAILLYLKKHQNISDDCFWQLFRNKLNDITQTCDLCHCSYTTEHKVLVDESMLLAGLKELYENKENIALQQYSLNSHQFITQLLSLIKNYEFPFDKTAHEAFYCTAIDETTRKNNIQYYLKEYCKNFTVKDTDIQKYKGACGYIMAFILALLSLTIFGLSLAKLWPIEVSVISGICGFLNLIIAFYYKLNSQCMSNNNNLHGCSNYLCKLCNCGQICCGSFEFCVQRICCDVAAKDFKRCLCCENCCCINIDGYSTTDPWKHILPGLDS